MDLTSLTELFSNNNPMVVIAVIEAVGLIWCVRQLAAKEKQLQERIAREDKAADKVSEAYNLLLNKMLEKNMTKEEEAK